MSKVRWFGLKSKVSIDELSTRLKHHSYTTEKGDGFVLDQVRPMYLVARFVERVHRVGEVVDPFGNPEKFERYEYRIQQFRISSDIPQLEFADAARNARTLISRLLEITDFDLVVEPFSIDPLEWASSIQSILGTRGIVDRVQARNVQAGVDALASVQIDARSDALSAFRTFIRMPEVKLDKVRVRLPNKMGTFVVSTAGGLEVSGPEQMKIIESARTSLSRLTMPG